MKNKITFHGYSNFFQLLWLVLLVTLFLSLQGCLYLAKAVSNSAVAHAENNAVVVLGDSVLALSGKVQDTLEEAAGRKFRRYSVAGAQLLDNNVLAPSIRTQWQQALNDDPNIDTVIFSGGGNDLLYSLIPLDQYGCLTDTRKNATLRPTCRAFIDQIIDFGEHLLEDFAKSGVKQVIYIGYYYPKNGLLRVKNLAAAGDYAAERFRSSCDGHRLQCHYVDTRPLVEPGEIYIDGLHPKKSAARKIGLALWQILKPILDRQTLQR